MTFVPIGIPWRNLKEAMAFFAWSIILLFLIYEQRFKLAVTGAFVVPIALVLMIFAATLDKTVNPLPPALQSHWLGLHTSVSFLGYAAFVITFACGLMYLIQERQLKLKRLGAIFHRLPPLDVMDTISYRALSIGWPLFTLGMITGSIWAESAWGTYWGWQPKETASLLVWVLYLAVLHLRTIGWRGRKMAWLSIAGFLFVLVSFFVVSRIGVGKHTF